MQKNLLENTFIRFREIFGAEKVEDLKWGRATFGYLITGMRAGKTYFVYYAAKDSIGRGGVVSVHKAMWDRATSENRQIILAFKGKWYAFTPKDVVGAYENEFTNLGTTKTMMNFPLKEGRNVEKISGKQLDLIPVEAAGVQS